MQSTILARGPFESQNVKIIVTKDNRLTNPEIESMIETTWEEVLQKAKAENQTLWNGPSLRVNDLEVNGDQLTLVTSVTDYKQRLGLTRNIDKIEHLGKEYFSTAMAVGCMVETTDNKYIFINRSSKSVNLNRTDLVGGVMDRIEATSGDDLIAHGYQEIQEETNLEQTDITSMSILGVTLSSNGSTVAVIHAKLNLNADEVLTKFALVHDEEIASLKIVPSSELKNFLIPLGSYKPSVVELMGL